MSPQQQRVLELIAQGLTNEKIAEALFVAPATVQRHVEDVRHKLGASNRAHAVALGYQGGLLGGDS